MLPAVTRTIRMPRLSQAHRLGRSCLIATCIFVMTAVLPTPAEEVAESAHSDSPALAGVRQYQTVFPEE